MFHTSRNQLEPDGDVKMCSASLYTSGNVVEVKNDHNHEPCILHKDSHLIAKIARVLRTKDVHK